MGVAQSKRSLLSPGDLNPPGVVAEARRPPVPRPHSQHNRWGTLTLPEHAACDDHSLADVDTAYAHVRTGFTALFVEVAVGVVEASLPLGCAQHCCRLSVTAAPYCAAPDSAGRPPEFAAVLVLLYRCLTVVEHFGLFIGNVVNVDRQSGCKCQLCKQHSCPPARQSLGLTQLETYQLACSSLIFFAISFCRWVFCQTPSDHHDAANAWWGLRLTHHEKF